jgi:hypothetical protein
MDDKQRQIITLLNQVQTLLEESERIAGPHLPYWRRMLGAFRSSRLLHRVGDLLAQVDELQGRPRHAEKLFGVGRDGWRVFQFVIGVLNAWSAIDSAYKAQWFSMTASVICIALTALWRLPYKPPRHQQSTNEGKP